MAAFHEAGSKMDIEQVKEDSAREQEVGTQTSTTLPMSPGDVVVSADLYGKATQREIPITSTV